MEFEQKNKKGEKSIVAAVKDLDVKINSGELVSLLGPSGCGKSTTLMMLSGLYKPTRGQIFFGDKDVTKIEAEHRGMGMVFQNYALYPHMSILKNIMFPLKMQKVPKAEREQKAMEMAKLVQIDHLVDRKPGQLSGGQQQRVAIARALVKHPNVLLLDEPLSNLDAKLRLEMREEIRRIQQEVGITTIFVTHDQEEAMSISDTVILMSAGEVVQKSTPQEMYKVPNSLFTAQFIGTPPMNIINNVPKDNAYGIDTKGKDNITVGIRPEHLFVTRDRSTSLLNAEVKMIERIGRDVLVKAMQAGQKISVLLNEDININIGDEISLAASLENIHCFDVETGKRY